MDYNLRKISKPTFAWSSVKLLGLCARFGECARESRASDITGTSKEHRVFLVGRPTSPFP